MASIILVLGLAFSSLVSTRTNSSKYRIFPMLMSVLLLGVVLLKVWHPTVFVYLLSVFLGAAVLGSVGQSRDWIPYVIPDAQGDCLLHVLICIGIAGLIAGAGGFPQYALPLVVMLGPAISLTAYWQLWCRKSIYWYKDGVRGLQRLQGTVQNPLYMGGALATLSVLAFSSGYWYAGLYCLPALFFSRSRSAYLATLVGGALLLGRIFPEAPWLATAEFVAVGLGVMMLMEPRFLAVSYEWVWGRGYAWRETLKLVRQKPWLGHGPGVMHLNMKNAESYATSPHNVFLHYLYGFGMVGLGAYAVVLWWGLAHASAMYLPALVAYMVYAQFSWDHVFPGYLFWVLLGLAQ